MWQAWINGILGLWIAVAPFVSMDVDSVKINNLLFGLIVAIVSWHIPKEGTRQRWSTMILGAWIFVAGCTPALVEGNVYLWNNLISGLLISMCAITLFLNQEIKQILIKEKIKNE